MPKPRLKRFRRRAFWLSLLLLVWLLCSGHALAGPLTDRLAQFPDWSGKPAVQAAKGDLAYPAWMAGTWHLKTTLVDLAAPLAPGIVTPGFEGNREWLGQPVECEVRFVPARPQGGWLPVAFSAPQWVSDRAFNGLNLARAYLGDAAVAAVKVDPHNPNRQVTLLADHRVLESTVTERATETPAPDTFATTEVFQQVFRGTTQPYLNQVETTTAYRRLAGDGPAIAADQVTAIYLSPQDPDFFKALGQPVALYRYQLEFFPADG